MLDNRHLEGRTAGTPVALRRGPGLSPLAPVDWLAVGYDTNLQTLAVHNKQAREMTAELGIAPTGHGARIRVPVPSE